MKFTLEEIYSKFNLLKWIVLTQAFPEKNKAEHENKKPNIKWYTEEVKQIKNKIEAISLVSVVKLVEVLCLN